MIVKLALLRGLSRGVWVHVFAYLTVFLRVLLFAGSRDSTVRLWEVATQRELAVLTGHTSDVKSVAFDGSGKYLASGGARGATSSSIAVFNMFKRYFLRCIVRAQLQLRIVLLIKCCCRRFFEFLLYDSEFDLLTVFDAFCLALRWLG